MSESTGCHVRDYDLAHDMGFVLVSPLVFTDTSISGGALRLYLILRDFAGCEVSAFPGRERLGELAGVSEKQVTRLTAELEERGLIEVEQRGLNKTNRYHMVPLTKVYGPKEAVDYCARKGRKIPPWLAGSERTDPSFPGRTDPSLQEGPDMSHKAYTDEADTDEADTASSPTASPPAQSRTRRRKVRNPLAREISKEAEERLARKAAALAEKTERERGGFAATTARSKSAEGGFGRGFDRKGDAFDAAAEGAENAPKRSRSKKVPEPEADPPHETTEFLPWSIYCSTLIRRPKSKGRGVKDFEEWNGSDFNAYIGYMASGWLGHEEPPTDTAKTRAQAKRLVTAIGGQKAKLMLDFCLENWPAICNRLRIDAAPLPNAALIEGYLQSLQKLKKDGIQKTDVGINRVKETYDDQPDEGW